jgi:hypothetical protein
MSQGIKIKLFLEKLMLNSVDDDDAKIAAF